ncbi:BPG-independent [Panaeolus papilionaceus]|nr:BPG-independent [Panaeolus papilionaceus]
MPLSALYPPRGRWRSLRRRLLFFVFLLLSVGSEVVVLNKYGEIADILGRYYAMDRDERWERIKIAVDGLVNGVGEKVDAEKGVVDDEKDTTDEFLKLIIVDGEEGRIKDDDTPFFFNYCSDRMCEIVSILGDVEHPSEFEGFKLPQHLVSAFSSSLVSRISTSANDKRSLGVTVQAGFEAGACRSSWQSLRRGYEKRLRPRGGGEEEEGVLWDVAPTVLDVMGLEKPKETTGRSWHRGYLKAMFHGGRRESRPGTYRRTLLHKNHKLNKNSRVVSQYGEGPTT